MEDHDMTTEIGQGISVRQLLSILRKVWWKAALPSLAVAAATLIVMLRMPNIYLAKAVVAPATEDGKQQPVLGVLSTFGIVVGGPSKVEDLEALFRSDDLTVRVFGKHKPWSIVAPDQYDAATGTIKVPWIDRALRGVIAPKPPTDWDAIRVAKNRMRVDVDKRSGTLSVSFESPSAEGSAAIVRDYLEEGKGRLQEEALERAGRNKRFIEEQIARTVDPVTKDRFYALYGQEVEREMLARNREQFGFKVIDSPRIPDRKSKPRRTLAVVLSFVSTFLLCTLAFSAFSVDRENLKADR